MSNTLYGHTAIRRICIDCGDEYYSNIYDPGAARCPVCRIMKYRKDDAEFMADIAKKNQKK